ncbi:MAG: polynucleotide adenylyltransferase PcnB, partial [Planctomycetota bacterium]
MSKPDAKATPDRFPVAGGKPRIVERVDHGVSRRDIDPDALKILYRLHQSGFAAYLVGGGVRDLMLGRRPKDFDIATDARPRQVKKLFRNCRIIGRRFRLAHLHYPDGKIIEVATFRSSSESDGIVRDGELIRRDNVYGTAEEDATRRDLTINGLFYNIGDFSVIDYVGGVEDLRAGLVRTIQDPVFSFREDPVRMMRAIRHTTRLSFSIEEQTRRALVSERDEILKANEARMIEELYKDLASGHAREYFDTLHEFGFLKLLLPDLVATFRQRSARSGKALLDDCLRRLDQMVRDGLEVTHSLGLAALFAPLILPKALEVEQTGVPRGALPFEPFLQLLGPIFQKRIRVYRRDQERLWHALGAWPRIAKALERGNIPVALRQRHYLRDAAEI